MVTKSVVVVNKGGELKEVTFKDFDISNLYKKCGFRKKHKNGKTFFAKRKKKIFFKMSKKWSKKINEK